MPPFTGPRPSNSKVDQQKGVKRTWRDRITPSTFKETDVFWHPAMSTPPPRCYTPGLIPVLKTYLSACHSRGEIRKAVLCYDQTVYIRREPWDLTWGCGYRNFLMACAVLMVQPFEPLYFPLLDEPIPPGIRNLQRWIELAWGLGFDPEGKGQLKKLIGTTNWIGTADLWIAFASRGIPAELVDFKPMGGGVQPLIDWAVKYFTPKPQAVPSGSDVPRNAFETLKGANAVVSTDIMPFVLQHSGHSRLIVGYEVDKQGKVNLLTFDCGIVVPKALHQYALSRRVIDQQANSSPKNALKRQASGGLGVTGSIKRTRSGTPQADDDSIEVVAEHGAKPTEEERWDDEIVITGFKSPEKRPLSKVPPPAPKSTPKPQLGAKDLQIFRITTKALERHNEYQILYFPMTSPLTEAERLQRRHPWSTVIPRTANCKV